MLIGIFFLFRVLKDLRYQSTPLRITGAFLSVCDLYQAVLNLQKAILRIININQILFFANFWRSFERLIWMNN